MTFTTAENPFIRPPPPKPVQQRYTEWVDEVERVFETTGETRLAKKGEFVLGLFGVAVANNDTTEPYPILREVAA